jgi:hypothetical protein
MTLAQEPRRSARSAQKPGTVSHQAQTRVDERVREIMAGRDDAESSDSRADQALSARRFLRRRVKSPR